MIRPISQQQVQNINNPYGSSLARLSQTFQNIGQQNQQNRLMKMQEEQQLLERRIKTAPIAKQFVDQAMALPEEQRAEFFLQNKDTISQLGFYDYSDINPNDFKNETLAQVSQRLGAMTKQRNGMIGKSEILPDGTVIQVTPNGPAVFSPTGEQLQGDLAKQAILNARNYEVDHAQSLYGGRRRGALEVEGEIKPKTEAAVVASKEGAKASSDAFDRLQQVKSSISNIDEGIKLIDEGAETGVVRSRLPSVRAASVKLDNLQKRLGIDVIGSVTFGALSEAELKLALDTALPMKLEGAELRKWLVEKKVAQEKLAAYLEEAVSFLGIPGNTKKDWLEHQKQKANKQEETKPANEDNAAIEWAKQNPDDPRAAQILQLNGAK